VLPCPIKISFVLAIFMFKQMMPIMTDVTPKGEGGGEEKCPSFLRVIVTQAAHMCPHQGAL